MLYTFYKITCKTNEELCYVGSTKDYERRKQAHKCACYNEIDRHYNLKVYQAIRANGGWNNFEMTPIAQSKFYDKKEALAFEQYFIDELHAKLNSTSAILDIEKRKEFDRKRAADFYKENKDRAKMYYEKNKDKIKEKTKAYKQANKEKCRAYTAKYNAKKNQSTIDSRADI